MKRKPIQFALGVALLATLAGVTGAYIAAKYFMPCVCLCATVRGIN